mmetsp:Transcript_45919/g.120390  ORF Transcript_45919/g.120390 Transcript_45919/m.120390 type:complete len:214 (-) Transcript_45919:662-1303(-)
MANAMTMTLAAPAVSAVVGVKIAASLVEPVSSASWPSAHGWVEEIQLVALVRLVSSVRLVSMARLVRLVSLNPTGPKSGAVRDGSVNASGLDGPAGGAPNKSMEAGTLRGSPSSLLRIPMSCVWLWSRPVPASANREVPLPAVVWLIFARLAVPFAPFALREPQWKGHHRGPRAPSSLGRLDGWGGARGGVGGEGGGEGDGGGGLEGGGGKGA